MSLATQAPSLPTQIGGVPDLPPGPSFDLIRGPIQESTFEPWQLLALCCITVLIASILLWKLLRYARGRHRLNNQLTPDLLARKELQEAAELIGDREYASALSTSLRNYLYTILNQNLTGRTTDELCDQLADKLPVDEKQLRAFFASCDTVKFASVPLPTSKRIQLLDTASTLIEQLESYHEQSSGNDSGGCKK